MEEPSHRWAYETLIDWQLGPWKVIKRNSVLRCVAHTLSRVRDWRDMSSKVGGNLVQITRCRSAAETRQLLSASTWSWTSELSCFRSFQPFCRENICKKATRFMEKFTIEVDKVWSLKRLGSTDLIKYLPKHQPAWAQLIGKFGPIMFARTERATMTNYWIIGSLFCACETPRLCRRRWQSGVEEFPSHDAVS